MSESTQDWALRRMRNNIANKRSLLAVEMMELSQLMEHRSRAISDGFHFSSLGEVQTRGQTIDRLCAELASQEEALEMMQTVVDSINEE